MSGEQAQRIQVGGMTCASCVSRVERALQRVPGVSDCSVNLLTGQARVHSTAPIEVVNLIAAVEKIGFTAGPPMAATSAQTDNEASALARASIIAALLTAPIFIIEMGGHLVPAFHHWFQQLIDIQFWWWLQALVVMFIFIWPGRIFFVRGIPKLYRFQPDMSSLVVLGASAAFLYSLLVMLLPAFSAAGQQAVYFESAAVIVSLILCGRYMEARARQHTSAAIHRLMDLRSDTVRVKRDDDWVDIPLEDVNAQDRILVRPGERIPVDGIVMSGTSHVDTAMVTGEPIPRSVQQGETVIGGCVNGEGPLQLRATAVGAESVLGHIIHLVGEAQASKLPIQALVDRVTHWFVPAVVLIAVISFVSWLLASGRVDYAVMNAVAVLIIACPCALGLATPTAIMVASGKGAELGILFRRGDAMQRLQEIKAIAFDKTGTLTHGKPTIADVAVTQAWDEATLVTWAAALETHSQHPLASAFSDIQNADKLNSDSVQQVQTISGKGTQGTNDGHQIHLGSDSWMQENKHVEANFPALSEAASMVWMAIDGAVVARFAVRDAVRPEAATVVAALQKAGIHTVLLSGDGESFATAVAKEIGMDAAFGALLPAEKHDHIVALQKRFAAVAFVGDGINDAPAMAQANVGIAIGGGSDVAIETADVVLMQPTLSIVDTALRLSRQTMRCIKQNLFWAFIYNICLIPVAAGLLYPIWGLTLSPMLAAMAMALSSVCVVLNALRLRRFR